MEIPAVIESNMNSEGKYEVEGLNLVLVGKWFGKTIDRLSSVSASVSGILLLLTTFVAFSGVVARYLAHAPLGWVIEFSTYSFIWFSFLALPEALRDQTHVRVTLFVGSLSPRMQVLMEVTQFSLCLVYGLILSWYGSIMVIDSFSLGDAGDMMNIPMWIIHLSLPIGMSIFSLQSFRMLVGKCHQLYATQLSTRVQLRNNPLFVFPVVSFLLIIGIFLMHTNASAGTVLLLLTLLAIGTHVGTSLGLTAATLYYFVLGGASQLRTLPIVGISSVGSWVLLAAPFFILVGGIANQGKIVEEMFEAIKLWIGRIAGCLGVSTIVTAAVFAAISGTSATNAAALSDACVPQLLKNNYDKRMATGAVSAGGTLGILIPPSLGMILYGSLTDESIGQLFIAGLIPGIILSLIFIAYIHVRCKQTGQHERYEPTIWRNRVKKTKEAVPGLLMPMLILGSIYTGIVTPTEAASLAAVYGLFVSLAMKKIRWQSIMPIAVRTSLLTSMIIFIMVGAMAIGNVTAYLKVPQNLSQAIVAANMPGWSVVFITMLIIMLLGMFLDGVSITLLTVPTLYPLILSLGFDPVWFAVILTVNLELATMTPPVGMNLYVVQGVTKIPMADVIRGSIPFMVLLVLGLVIFALIPQLSLWLPSMLR